MESHHLPPSAELDSRIRDVLAALKHGIGAAAVGIFDDDRTRMYLSSEASPTVFWDSLRAMPCLKVDWPSWYRELRGTKRRSAGCGCSGAHAVHGLLLHERWILLVVAGGPLFPGAESVMSSAAGLIAGLLPAVRVKLPSPGAGGRGGPAPARLGIPLRWARKSHA